METFRSVVGHKRVISYLQESVRSGHVSHAYLLDGPDGVGKRLVATLFTATLLCREGGDEPCGKCISCRQMDGGNQPDVTWVTHEKSVISVGDIRTQLCNVVQVKPMAGPYRVFIVDEAERMNAEAQNALLKTLEEPPSYAVILLLTNNAESLLPTIRSRSVLLQMLPAPEDELVEWLMDRAKLPDYRARLAAAYAGGSPGQALACARSEDFAKMRDAAVSMMKAVPTMREDRMSQLAKDFASGKDAQETTLALITVWLRDVMAYKAVGKKAKLMYQEDVDSVAAHAESLRYEDVWALSEELSKIRANRAVNVNMETAFWLFLLKMQKYFKDAE